MGRRRRLSVLIAAGILGGGGDTTAPTVTGFAVTTPSSALAVPITTFTASEAGVYFLITENSTPPAVGAAGWNLTAPTTYVVSANGDYTLYPWAQDAAGNVSAVYGSPVSVHVSTILANLISYYKLGEASGSRADSAGSNTLTDNGSAGNAAGVVGNAVAMNGTMYLSSNSNASLQVGDIDFWVDGWLYLTDLLSYYAVACKDGTTREWFIWFDKDVNKLTFSLFKPAEVALKSAQTLSATTWYYFAAWHDAAANTMHLQINGNAAASQATGGALQVAGTDQFTIGSRSAGAGNKLKGRVDELGFWKRIPVAADLTARYNGGAGNTHPF